MTQDKIREAMQKWLVEIAQQGEYNICLTITFNKLGITEPEAIRAIKVAFGTWYRKKLGKKWYQKKESQYKLIGFREKGKSRDNLHYHFMIKVEVEAGILIQMQMLLKKGIRKVVPSADVLCQCMYDPKWASYISKEVRMWDNSLITEKDLW